MAGIGAEVSIAFAKMLPLGFLNPESDDDDELPVVVFSTRRIKGGNKGIIRSGSTSLRSSRMACVVEIRLWTVVLGSVRCNCLENLLREGCLGSTGVGSKEGKNGPTAKGSGKT